MQQNGMRNASLPINKYTHARAQAAQPSKAAIAKRQQSQQSQQVKAALALVDAVLHGDLAKRLGGKSPQVGLGEMLQSALMRKRLEREGRL